jgi:hypothetical protein
MPYRLKVRKPCRVSYNGQVRRLRPNDQIVVGDGERRRLTRGIYQDKFKVIGYVEESQPSKKEKEKEVSSSEEEGEKEVSSSEEEGDQPSFSAHLEEDQTASEESEDQPQVSVDEVAQDDQLSLEEKLGKLSLPNVPYSEGTHWATVKSYVLDLENQVPIPKELIKATKLKFYNYKAVVEECDRILSEHDV